MKAIASALGGLMRHGIGVLLALVVACSCDNGETTPPVDGGLDGSLDGSAEPLIVDLLPEPEICDNGIDDNGNGDVDCADIQCAARSLEPSEGTHPQTPFVDQVRFLWEGASCPPLQVEFAEGAFDSTSVAVVTGQVRAEDGSPFAGARVVVVGHPEFGATETRGDGRFDIALLGGRTATIAVHAEGHIPSHRSLPLVRRGTFARVEDIVLLEHGPMVMVDTATGGVFSARESVDEDGPRSLSLMMPAGTRAMARGAAGERPMERLGLRIREFTVGVDGPARMPGTLPDSSAYTYAVELGVEGLADDESIRFDRPVPIYLDNFLDFPIGTSVPVGSYSREEGRWVPEENGLVVEVLGVREGLAELDLDGSGTAASATELQNAGIDPEELRNVATSYPAGTGLWRFAPEHFSPWDLNWGLVAPGDAIAPPLRELPPRPLSEDSCEPGSEIRVERQVLGEDFPVVGTGFSLHYASDAQPGYLADRAIRVQITPDVLPASVTEVRVELEIAGRRVTATYPPAPGLVFAYEWDGRDAFLRRFVGVAPYTLRVGYAYPANYAVTDPDANPRGFGQASGVQLVENETRREAIVWQERFGVLRAEDARTEGLLGLRLNVHHRYDAAATALLRGDGGRRLGSALPRLITHMAGGNGSSTPGDAAADFAFGTIHDLAVDSEGRTLVATDARIWRIEGDGSVSVFAGTGTLGADGDGGPARDADLAVTRMAFGPDGALYFTSGSLHRIRRIRIDGIVETVAGTGEFARGADGALAANAPVSSPAELALGPDGTLYYVNFGGQLRSIGTDGRLRTIGDPSGVRLNEDDVPLADARFDRVGGLAMSPGGELFVAQGSSLYRIRADGRVVRYAGAARTTPDASMSGSPALEVGFGAINQPVFESDGTLWLLGGAAGGWQLWRIDPNGIASYLGGSFLPARSEGDGGPVRSATFGLPIGLSATPDGSVLLSDFDRVRRISRTFGAQAAGETVVPARSGGARYIFDSHGDHLRTETGYFGYPILAFEHNDARELEVVRDPDGNSLTITRPDVSTVVLTPMEGPPTRLIDTDSDGYADRIEIEGDAHPALLEYSPDHEGLLTRLVDRYGFEHRYGYDPLGRLEADGLADHPPQRLERDEATGEVSLTSPEGRTTRYGMSLVDESGLERHTTNAAGHTVRYARDLDGRETVTYPDGTSIARRLVPDDILGAAVLVPEEATLTTPSGRALRSRNSRVGAIDEGRLVSRTASVTERLDTEFEATSTSTIVRHADGTSTLTSRSAEGRESEVDFDDRGRPIRIRTPGRHPVAYLYDAHGRIEETRIGPGNPAVDRTTTLTFGAIPSREFQPVAAENSEGQMLTTEFDGVGRASVLSDLAGSLGLMYDEDDRSTAITPPGRPAHQTQMNERGWLGREDPPPVAEGETPTTYSYDNDGYVERIALPDGRTMVSEIDAEGRFVASRTEGGSPLDTASRGTTDVDPITGHTTALHFEQGTGNTVSIEPVYDGPLLESVISSGPGFSASIERTFDDAFRLSSTRIVVAGRSVELQTTLDLDDLWTGLSLAGTDIALTRNPLSADAQRLQAGTVRTDYTVNGFGEFESTRSTWTGGAVLDFRYTFDRTGRVRTRTTERRQGAATTRVETFNYDDSGRVASVDVDGAAARFRYEYDENGNRIGWRTPSTGCDSLGDPTRCVELDAQDRLLRHGVEGAAGTLAFTYNASGQMLSRTVAANTTHYDHTAEGYLRGVELPDGRSIRYLFDSFGRRVAREVDGARSASWVYGGGVVPLAQLDPAGELETVFVYAEAPWSPSFALHHEGGEWVLYRVLVDQTGSVRTVVRTSDGQVVQEYRYSPYGEIIESTELLNVVPFRFAGGLFDEDTGLTHFHAREYDAHLGRFISKDPLGFAGGDTNLYAYVGGDPVNFVDPNGLEREWDLQLANWLDRNGVDDFAAGFGDNVSFGLTEGYRYLLGADGTIDRCSDAYAAGEWSAIGLGVLEGGYGIAAGLRGARAARAARAARTGCFPAGTDVTVGNGELQSIESLQLGDRVRPTDTRCEHWEGNLHAISLEFVDNGTPVAVELLRDDAWLLEHAISPRGPPHPDEAPRVWIELEDLQGFARVRSVRPALVADGPGCPVTGRYFRQVDELVDLWLEGRTAPIGLTPMHPLFSETRGTWTEAGELQPGELVRTDDGPMAVALLARRQLDETVAVFNLEVAHVHQYRVADGVWAHNNCGPAGGPLAINVGGEGEVAGALNVQIRAVLDPAWRSSRGGLTLAELQAQGHRFLFVDDISRLPFANNSVSRVYTNSVPLDRATFLGPGPSSPDIARVMAPGAQWFHNGMLWFQRLLTP